MPFNKWYPTSKLGCLHPFYFFRLKMTALCSPCWQMTELEESSATQTRSSTNKFDGKMKKVCISANLIGHESISVTKWHSWPRLLCESAMKLPCFQAKDVCCCCCCCPEPKQAASFYRDTLDKQSENTVMNNSTYLLATKPWLGTNTDRDVPENVFLLSLVFVHFSDKPTNLHFHPGTSVPNHSLANKSFIFIPKRNHTICIKGTLQSFPHFSCITVNFLQTIFWVEK